MKLTNKQKRELLKGVDKNSDLLRYNKIYYLKDIMPPVSLYISEDDLVETIPNTITELEISNVNFSELPKDIFKKFTGTLESLEIKRSKNISRELLRDILNLNVKSVKIEVVLPYFKNITITNDNITHLELYNTYKDNRVKEIYVNCKNLQFMILHKILISNITLNCPELIEFRSSNNIISHFDILKCERLKKMVFIMNTIYFKNFVSNSVINLYFPTCEIKNDLKITCNTLSSLEIKKCIMSKIILNAPELKLLIIADIPITTFPEGIYNSHKLDNINIYNTSIETLPEDFFETLPLTYFRSNTVSSIRSTHPENSKLKILDLWNHKISDSTMPKFPELHTLALNNTGLKTVSDTIFELPKLTRLFINDNELITLPENIDKPPLKMLDLSNNDLKTLPITIGKIHENVIRGLSSEMKEVYKKYRILYSDYVKLRILFYKNVKLSKLLTPEEKQELLINRYNSKLVKKDPKILAIYNQLMMNKIVKNGKIGYLDSNLIETTDWMELCRVLGEEGISILSDLLEDLGEDSTKFNSKRKICGRLAELFEMESTGVKKERNCINDSLLDFDYDLLPDMEIIEFTEEGKKFCFALEELEGLQSTRENPFTKRRLPDELFHQLADKQSLTKPKNLDTIKKTSLRYMNPKMIEKQEFNKLMEELYQAESYTPTDKIKKMDRREMNEFFKFMNKMHEITVNGNNVYSIEKNLINFINKMKGEATINGIAIFFYDFYENKELMRELMGKYDIPSNFNLDKFKEYLKQKKIAFHTNEHEVDAKQLQTIISQIGVDKIKDYNEMVEINRLGSTEESYDLDSINDEEIRALLMRIINRNRDVFYESISMPDNDDLSEMNTYSLARQVFVYLDPYLLDIPENVKNILRTKRLIDLTDYSSRTDPVNISQIFTDLRNIPEGESYPNRIDLWNIAYGNLDVLYDAGKSYEELRLMNNAELRNTMIDIFSELHDDEERLFRINEQRFLNRRDDNDTDIDYRTNADRGYESDDDYRISESADSRYESNDDDYRELDSVSNIRERLAQNLLDSESEEDD